jgi:hypothetical protein
MASQMTQVPRVSSIQKQGKAHGTDRHVQGLAARRLVVPPGSDECSKPQIWMKFGSKWVDSTRKRRLMTKLVPRTPR